MATIDGQALLGIACHVVETPNPRASQRDSYAGQDGYTLLDCGSRGGRIKVTGVLVADTPFDCFALAAALIGLQGPGSGLHTLADDSGRSWSVYFDGRFQASPGGAVYSDQGWCLPYELHCEYLQ